MASNKFAGMPGDCAVKHGPNIFGTQFKRSDDLYEGIRIPLKQTKGVVILDLVVYIYMYHHFCRTQ